MIQDNDRLVFPASDQLGDWIVKLPDPAFANVPSNEAAMMSLASLSGIDVPEHRLVDRDQIASLPDRAWLSGETLAYSVRRFDRSGDGGRIHIEDFAQVRGKYPGSVEKYEGSFETVAALCYRDVDLRALREWARRIAFNLVIGNGDAHLKNWSLIYPDGRVPTLSPAYDLVSTVQHIPNDDFGLKFTGRKQFTRVLPGGFAAVEHRLGADGADLEACAAQTIYDAAHHASEIAERFPLARATLDWVASNAPRVATQLRL